MAIESLSITILECAQLISADITGTSDPYVIVSLNGKSHKTKVYFKTLEPVFNETFIFKNIIGEQEDELDKQFIIFEVLDADVLSKHDYLGTVVLPLNVIYDPIRDEGKRRKKIVSWIPLQENAGRIHVSIEIKMNQRKSQINEENAIRKQAMRTREEIKDRKNRKAQQMLYNSQHTPGTTTSIQHDGISKKSLHMEMFSDILENGLGHQGHEINSYMTANTKSINERLKMDPLERIAIRARKIPTQQQAPSHRFKHSSIGAQENLFVFSGQEKCNETLNDMYQFNSLTGEWAKTSYDDKKTPPPLPRDSSSGVYIPSTHSIVVMNGKTNDDFIGLSAPKKKKANPMTSLGMHNDEDIVSDIYEYTINTGEWNPIHTFGKLKPKKMYGHTLHFDDYTQSLYVYGGYPLRRDDMYRLDLKTFQWENVTYYMPRKYKSSKNFGNKYFYHGNRIRFRKKWLRKKRQRARTMPIQYSLHYNMNMLKQQYSQNEQYLFCYCVPIPRRIQAPTNRGIDSERRHFHHETTTKKLLPPTRFYHSSVMTENRQLVVYGGIGNQTIHNDIWLYDFDHHAWLRVYPLSGKSKRRYGHAASYHDQMMYVYGGVLPRGKSHAAFQNHLDRDGMSVISGVTGTESRAQPSHSLSVFSLKTYRWRKILLNLGMPIMFPSMAYVHRHKGRDTSRIESTPFRRRMKRESKIKSIHNSDAIILEVDETSSDASSSGYYDASYFDDTPIHNAVFEDADDDEDAMDPDDHALLNHNPDHTFSIEDTTNNKPIRQETETISPQNTHHSREFLLPRFSEQVLNTSGGYGSFNAKNSIIDSTRPSTVSPLNPTYSSNHCLYVFGGSTSDSLSNDLLEIQIMS